MRKKAELVSAVLALLFIAAAAFVCFAGQSEGIVTQYPATRAQLESGSGDVDELMPGETVDINSADAGRLMLLPGIGEAIADRVIEYRRENGPFASPEDIMRVSGIGEAKFAAIEEYIRTD